MTLMAKRVTKAARSPKPPIVSELSDAEIDALAHGAHGDPFARLGMHKGGDGRIRVRVMVPLASRVAVLSHEGREPRILKWLDRIHSDGVFEGVVPLKRNAFRYRLRVQYARTASPDASSGGTTTIDCDDPYRFGPLLDELDSWLLGEGRHLRSYERLGAHLRSIDDTSGTAFAVWAPNARRMSVVGDFNAWDGRRHPMRLRRETGVWEIFIPDVGLGARYKYELIGADGTLLPLRSDPYAFRAELRPGTASIVAQLPPIRPADETRRRANALDAPIAIYEVHLGSWRRKVEAGDRFLDWDELADELVAYVSDMGFTHIELLPVSEHPFDGSWGYQPIGLYAPSARFGAPDGMHRFVARCHDAGIGVLIDWVPAHFPSDAHGLGRFDGTPLYEHADPREGFHKDWNTLIYNFGRNEVVNFLIGNALYWIERYGLDGLRVDAVASMLYRDYSRAAGEWVPNAHGGRENLEAVDFIRRLNEIVGVQRSDAVMCAEESTAWPMVTRPPSAGGLGFHYKWNLGWMHDTLAYMQRDPLYRRHHQDELTFGLVYAFNENFILPLSHDEVVHGKGSLLSRMPGDRWQQFANLRAYFAFMYAHPGKKLLFMGCEFAQEREWNHDQSLDWHLLDDPLHRGVQTLVRDLNRVYRERRALHERDVRADGFDWIDHGDHAQSVVAFIRLAGDRGEDSEQFVVVVSNFTPIPRNAYRVGVPRAGYYREIINTDSSYYGGSNLGNPSGSVQAEAVPAHGRAYSIVTTLPPLATIYFEWTI